MSRNIEYETYKTNISAVIDINVKYIFNIKNTWDIVHIIDVQTQNTWLHMCTKFEVSNANISGLFYIMWQESKYGCHIRNTYDTVHIIDVNTGSI